MTYTVSRPPIVMRDTIARIVVCPSCKGVIYDSDWTRRSQEEYHRNFCMRCFQRLTPTGRYLGFWECEEYSDMYYWQFKKSEGK